MIGLIIQFQFAHNQKKIKGSSIDLVRYRPLRLLSCPLGAAGLLLWYQNYAPSGRKIKLKSAGKSHFLRSNGRTRII